MVSVDIFNSLRYSQNHSQFIYPLIENLSGDSGGTRRNLLFDCVGGLYAG